MKKYKKMYTTAVATACDLCGISFSDYCDGRNEAAVDARMLVIGWLTGYGFTESRLAGLTGWSQQRINYIKNHASFRLIRRVFREQYDAMTTEMSKMF